ncbi:hypothetical protein [Mycobacterium paraintracellulare]|uniref:hypothetical protein n=1 Tax=Mycobacterium paraintracellulare TaxID=1138383 RepID=UPI0019159340|nr:hypothetical protein [Mycobacterium paraintracellulare]
MTVRTGRRAAKQLGPEANPAQMPLSDLASFRAHGGDLECLPHEGGAQFRLVLPINARRSG